MAGITAHNFVYKAPFMQAGPFLPFAWAGRGARKWAGRLLFSARAPAALRFAPFDMHLADPKLAHEFYHGRFPLGGRVVQAGSVSPFLIEPPSAEWENALHDFSWLNHMAAAQTELADAHARALTLDWLEEAGRKPEGRAWAPGTAARRLSAFLAHGDMLLAQAAQSFQKLFLKSLGLHKRYLRAGFFAEQNNADRLIIACALAMAELAAPAAAGKKRQSLALARAARRLEAELARQILPDGGHISRCPAALPELLAYLIPLRYAYQHCGQTPPPLLVFSLDRMLPALRFFRHRDGTLANFNGVGPVLAQRLDIVLDADDAAGAPFSQAPHSGYQRLAAGETVLVADTGASFSKKLTESANAGCLSFEMSSGLQRFIVNCGTDPYGPPEFRFFGRLTAAHSTAAVEDSSSCAFADSDNPQSRFSRVMPNVRAERIKTPDAEGFIAAHDGYKRAFNLIHERALTLSRSGDRIEGSDRFFSAGGKKRLFGGGQQSDDAQIAVRFHIYPDIAVIHEGAARDEETGEERAQIRLRGADGESWLFSANMPIMTEDSIYFSGLSGPEKTQQLVLNFNSAERSGVEWRLERDSVF